MTLAGECDDCTFPEVEILDDDNDGPLRAGMKVLAPCPECGCPPIEHLSWLEHTANTTQESLDLLIVDRSMTLFHWAPAARRKQINRFGLRPSMRPTTNAHPDYTAPYVCLGHVPSWAWALSGAQRGAPAGEWDLWQTRADRLVEPHVVPSGVDNGIHEVRTDHRIYKRDLWLIGSRVKG